MLGDVDELVDNLHDVFGVVAGRVVVYGDAVLVEEVVLVVVPVGDLLDEVLGLLAGALGVLLGILVDCLGNDFEEAAVQELHKRRVDFLMQHSLQLLAGLLNVEQYVLGSIGLALQLSQVANQNVPEGDRQNVLDHVRQPVEDGALGLAIQSFAFLDLQRYSNYLVSAIQLAV